MPSKKKILIIGAGPAGLGCGYELSLDRENRFKVDIVEAEDKVGGLSKTLNFEGYSYDLGAHRFFSKIKEVNDLWEKTLKKDFLVKKRKSRIYYKTKFFEYPLKLTNVIMNIGMIESFKIGLSIVKSQISPYKEERNFKEYIINRFGERLYETFFKEYTEKVWGLKCEDISSDWGSQRIKDLSVFSLVMKKVMGENAPKSLVSEFRYPRYGAGMMYESIKKNIVEKKNFRILTGSKVEKLAFKNKKWEATISKKKGTITLSYDHIISSMPLSELIHSLDFNIPNDILQTADKLSYRSLILVYLVFKEKIRLNDNWIYLNNSSIKAGRMQILNNWSQSMLKDKNNSSYSIEYFCTEGDELWIKKDTDLIHLAITELKKLKLIKNKAALKSKVVRLKKAYPVYDTIYTTHMKDIIDFIDKLPNLQVIGRNGMFRYNNMDHSIYTGMLAARNLFHKDKKYNLWQINQDRQYQES